MLRGVHPRVCNYISYTLGTGSFYSVRADGGFSHIHDIPSCSGGVCNRHTGVRTTNRFEGLLVKSVGLNGSVGLRFGVLGVMVKFRFGSGLDGDSR